MAREYFYRRIIVSNDTITFSDDPVTLVPLFGQANFYEQYRGHATMMMDVVQEGGQLLRCYCASIVYREIED